MVDLQLDWQQASALGVALVGGHATSTRSRRTAWMAPYLRESAIIAGLYSLWQIAGSYSLLGAGGALSRGRWIERFEHAVRLPDERAMQRLILDHPLFAQGCDLYYVSMHFTGLGVFLVWLFIRHQDRYPFVRNVLVALTASCLLIQFVPVAPPRLLPDLGFVDVAARYGQSVYEIAGLSVDALAAMPSVHVGWALLVAWAVVTVSSSRHRWWVLLHPALTIFVVVATGNHFWLDGIVAAALLVGSVCAVRWLTQLSTERRRVAVDYGLEPASAPRSETDQPVNLG